MTKKRLIAGTLIVLILLSLVTVRVWSVLNWKRSDGILKFYQYDNNCMDVIVYGPSRSFCTINPALMWDRYGMAVVNAGEAGQNIGSTYYYMLETLKTQSPKVMLIEVSMAVDMDNGMDGNLYANTINLKWSKNYIDNAVYEWKHSGYSDSFAMLKWLVAKFPIFHSRYDELTEADYTPVTNEESVYIDEWSTESYPTPAACAVTETEPMVPESIEYMDRMIELAEQNGAVPVFFVAPYVIDEDQMKMFNDAEAYITAKGYDFINCNAKYQEIGFDYGTDLREEASTGKHVNNSGAAKVTDYLADHLHEKYDLPDRRGEAGYEVFEKQSEEWAVKENNHAIVTGEDNLAKVIELADPDRYDMALVVYHDKDQLLDAISETSPHVAEALADTDIYTTTGFDSHGISRLGNEIAMTRDGKITIGKEVYDQINQRMVGGIVLAVTEKKTGDLILTRTYRYENGESFILW